MQNTARVVQQAWDDGARDYRQEALSRLLQQRGPFASEQNIQIEMAKWVSITCPYCSKPMTWEMSSGSKRVCSALYRCDCGAGILLEFHAPGGIMVTPPQA